MKRRWWKEHERFRKVYRRLRLNYDRTLARESAQIEERAEAKIKAANMLAAQRVQIAEESAGRLAAEISRVRLEFGPHNFGARFQMVVTMDETMMRGAHDLKTLGPYIIEVLTMKIRREFSQIDFGRAKPVMPDHPNGPRRWSLDSSDLLGGGKR